MNANSLAITLSESIRGQSAVFWETYGSPGASPRKQKTAQDLSGITSLPQCWLQWVG